MDAFRHPPSDICYRPRAIDGSKYHIPRRTQMFNRCSDTHIYVSGRYTASGEARYEDPETGAIKYVVCGRNRPGLDEIHARDLKKGAVLRVPSPAGSVDLAFFPKNSGGRRGRAEFNANKVERHHGAQAALAYAAGASAQLHDAPLGSPSAAYNASVRYQFLTRATPDAIAASQNPAVLSQARSQAVRAETISLVTTISDYAQVSDSNGSRFRPGALESLVARDPEFITLMNDSTFLSNMAIDSESEAVRAAFITRVASPYVLFAAAIADESSKVRFEAVQRISDPDILLRVMEDDTDTLVAEAAGERLAYVAPSAHHTTKDAPINPDNDSYTKNGYEYTRAGTDRNGVAVYACNRPNCPCSTCPGTATADPRPTYTTTSGMTMTASDAWTKIDMPDQVMTLTSQGTTYAPAPASSRTGIPITEKAQAAAVKVADLARRLNDTARQYDFARDAATSDPGFNYITETALLSREVAEISKDIDYLTPEAKALSTHWATSYDTETALGRLKRQAEAMEVIVNTAKYPNPDVLDEHVGVRLATRVGLRDTDPNWNTWGALLSGDPSTIAQAASNPDTASAPDSFGSSLVGLLRDGPSGSKEILMVATKRNPSEFQPVGGRTELGEDHLTTALREVEEEVGLSLSPATLSKKLVSGMCKRQGDMVFYSAELTAEQAASIRLDNPEFSGPARWMSIDEALAQPSFPSTKSFLRRLLPSG